MEVVKSWKKQYAAGRNQKDSGRINRTCKFNKVNPLSILF